MTEAVFFVLAVNAPGAAFPYPAVGLVAGFIPGLPGTWTVRKTVSTLVAHFLLESAAFIVTFL